MNLAPSNAKFIQKIRFMWRLERVSVGCMKHEQQGEVVWCLGHVGPSVWTCMWKTWAEGDKAHGYLSVSPLVRPRLHEPPSLILYSSMAASLCLHPKAESNRGIHRKGMTKIESFLPTASQRTMASRSMSKLTLSQASDHAREPPILTGGPEAK